MMTEQEWRDELDALGDERHYAQTSERFDGPRWEAAVARYWTAKARRDEAFAAWQGRNRRRDGEATR